MSIEQFGRALETVTPGGAVKPWATKLVLLTLAWHADAHGRNAWPSVTTMARMTGMDPRTVQRALRLLEAAKLIAVAEPAKGKLATVYSLNLNPRPIATRQSVTGDNEPPLSQSTPGGGAQRGGGGAQRGDNEPPNPSWIRPEPTEKSASARVREDAPLAPDLNGTGRRPRAEPVTLALSPAQRLLDIERRRRQAALLADGHGLAHAEKASQLSQNSIAPRTAETESISAVSPLPDASVAPGAEPSGT